MHVAVVANGELPNGVEESVVSLLVTADRVIAADGGIAHCQAVDRWPDVLVGDLDSAPPDLVDQARAQAVRIVEHPTDKDATDLDLALREALGMGATQVTIVAPFGGRLDHELGTIGLIAGPSLSQVEVAATDGRRHMWVVRDRLQLALEPGITLSLLPWGGQVTGVSISGVRWPLAEATLALGSTRGVSNVVEAAQQEITLDTGTLLVIVDAG